MKAPEAIQVLVVEDDFMVAEMIKGMLEDIGYTITGKAVNGEQAIALTKTLQPDVILMDIEMPKMDGIEAARYIQEYCPTPVVVLSAYESRELVEQTSEAGVGAYLLKPLNVQEVERAITVAIARFDDMMALRAHNQELDAFAHTVAHDLKSPLGLILAYAELLQEESILTENLRKYLTAIIRNSHKMDNIIDELLLLAGVRKANVVLEPLNMGRIVTEVQRRLAYMIEASQARIITPDHWPVAIGYGPWVEEIWVNYLSNAIKYGGQPPDLRLGATPSGTDAIRFWVHDNGDGLTQEEQARLFTPFTQFHQIEVKGHGLGLSIVQRIAEKLGGEVGVESTGKAGKGSIFYFILPTSTPKK